MTRNQALSTRFETAIYDVFTWSDGLTQRVGSVLLDEATKFVYQIIEQSPRATFSGKLTNPFPPLLLPEDPAMPDVIYRVIKLPETLLAAMREFRDRTETTNVKVVVAAVENNLPSLVEDLKRLGFGTYGGNPKAARLPFSDEAAVLGQLKEAAETVGLPATRLLEFCLVAAVEPRKDRKRRWS